MEINIKVPKGGSCVQAKEQLEVIEWQKPSDIPKVTDKNDIITHKNAPVEITLTGSYPDSTAAKFSIASKPSNGCLDTTDLPMGKVTYTRNTDYTGPDSFQFKVNYGKAGSNIATVKITGNEATQ